MVFPSVLVSEPPVDRHFFFFFSPVPSPAVTVNGSLCQDWGGGSSSSYILETSKFVKAGLKTTCSVRCYIRGVNECSHRQEGCKALGSFKIMLSHNIMLATISAGKLANQLNRLMSHWGGDRTLGGRAVNIMVGSWTGTVTSTCCGSWECCDTFRRVKTWPDYSNKPKYLSLLCATKHTSPRIMKAQ